MKHLCRNLIVTLACVAIAACSQFNDPLSEGPVQPEHAEAIDNLNLELVSIKDSGPFIKVIGLDALGNVKSEALDNEGRAMLDWELAQLTQNNPKTPLDPKSQLFLDTELAQASVVELVMYPRVQLPEEVDPAVLVKATKTKGDALFAQYRKAVKTAQKVAAAKLMNELPTSVQILGTVSGGVHVRAERDSVDALILGQNLDFAQLHPSFLPSAEGGSAAANEAINLDALTEGPVRWDGNGNGSKVLLGLYEGTGIKSSWPRLPQGHGGVIFQRTQSTCSQHADCGRCGETPDDNRNGCQCVAGGCIANHVTSVFSVLSTVDDSVNPPQQIGMRDARVYYANKGFASGVQWFANNNVHIMSLSQYGGSISAQLRDKAVRTHNIAISNLATNGGVNATSCASPNTICVGNYNHVTNNIANSSASKNFSRIDREQPDLVAPGTQLNTYRGNGTWARGSGTSFSAPMLATVIAGLYDLSKTKSEHNNYYPWLDQYPEATKALLMAASTNNIMGDDISRAGGSQCLEPKDTPGCSEGIGSAQIQQCVCARDSFCCNNRWDELCVSHISQFDCTVLPDERDGAGAIDVAELKSIWNKGQWSIRRLRAKESAQTLWRTVHLNAGQTIRAYLAWSRCPSSDIRTISTDLDLRLFGPNGDLVDASDSYHQTYEGISYTAPVTGKYQIRSHRWYMNRCAGETTTAENVGLAYHIQ